MTITRRLGLAAAVAAAACVAGTAPAVAATSNDSGSLTCTSGNGDLFCTGKLMNATVAGTGGIVPGGSYEDDSCLTGNGMGSTQAWVPVATVLGERHLLIDASYGYVRIGATRVASGYATVTLSQTRSFPFGETRADEGEETRRVRFSSVAQLTGDDLDGCPFNPGPSAKWAEQMGFGAAADDVEANGNPRASGLRRGACANRQRGTSSADRLMGTSAGDAISGAGGADSISGLAGHDCLKGDAGSDSLGGGAGHDSLQGGRGGDKLVGGAGNDALSGGAGKDSFSAGAGNDVIQSRDGRAEKVSCGSGKDSVRADASDRLAGCESRRNG